MKLSITIVLLAIASYVFAQSNNSNSRSTKIDENEKKRLENQFKTLNNFYIDDDGLVVYQTQENQSSKSQEETPVTTTGKTSSASENVKSQESEKQHSKKEESPKAKSTPIEKPINNPQTVSSNESQAPATNRASTSSGIIRKEALRPTEAITDTRASERVSTETGSETRTIKNSPIITQQREELPQPETKLAETNTKNTAPAKSTAKKSSVFDKKVKPSQFKTMEEAALAVEALLEDLRKEQSQTTSAGSMSSRLSGGAGRSTLRKKPATNPSYNTDSSSEATPKKNQTIIEEEESPFGNEPTYYINGKEVDRVEVNRLRKKEIISKEVRTRNTVSGNPNGEVWYEVKYDN
ncbi:hypothetical protein [Dysgonomonas alginatilytica]|nr:hypothetical protein [Dysgonomonas alginatilytica]